ncbi:MAG: hypothetical protein QUS11_04125 [Candidatus Fermentibacter sp.]|nr:hypothetical protein [Candidatus Fermentibacter sp.]
MRDDQALNVIGWIAELVQDRDRLRNDEDLADAGQRALSNELAEVRTILGWKEGETADAARAVVAERDVLRAEVVLLQQELGLIRVMVGWREGKTVDAVRAGLDVSRAEGRREERERIRGIARETEDALDFVLDLIGGEQ